MSLVIVEDGTGIRDANAYADLSVADAYLVARGLWTATPTVTTEATDDKPPTSGPDASVVAAKEAAIIRAADALAILRWKGEARFPLSLMAWPRVGVEVNGVEVPIDAVPPAVVRANIELAGLLYNGTADPLAPVERGGKIISKSESYAEGNVDVIGGDSKSYSVTYSEAAPVETYLPAVYGILRPYLRAIPGQSGSVVGSVVGRVVRG